MIYQVDELVKEYYNKVTKLYPNISFDKFEKICKLPFYWIRAKMQDNSFPTLHIKYLGKFIVYPGKVKAFIKHLDLKLSKGLIEQEEYDRDTKYLKEFLKNNNEETFE